MKILNIYKKMGRVIGQLPIDQKLTESDKRKVVRAYSDLENEITKLIIENRNLKR